MRRTALLATLLTAALQVLPAVGTVAYDAAGVVAYSRIQGKTYVLLADHLVEPERGWAAFGGGQDGDESPARTASREFREETRCVYDYPSEEDLRGKPTVTQGSFISYVVEVPFVPAQVFLSRSVPDECTGPDYSERGLWVWVPLVELERCLAAADSTGGFALSEGFVPKGSTTKLWGKSATVMQKAIEEGFLE
jgi:ADP-ribose pyrophosphatase YjhB (NUDIX family)